MTLSKSSNQRRCPICLGFPWTRYMGQLGGGEWRGGSMQKPGKSWANWHKLVIQGPSGNLKFAQNSRRLGVKQPRLTQVGVFRPAGHPWGHKAVAGTLPNPLHAHKPSTSHHMHLRYPLKTPQPQVLGSQHLQQPSLLADGRLTPQLPSCLGGQRRGVLHTCAQGATKLALVTCPPMQPAYAPSTSLPHFLQSFPGSLPLSQIFIFRTHDGGTMGRLLLARMLDPIGRPWEIVKKEKYEGDVITFVFLQEYRQKFLLS